MTHEGEHDSWGEKEYKRLEKVRALRKQVKEKAKKDTKEPVSPPAPS